MIGRGRLSHSALYESENWRREMWTKIALIFMVVLIFMVLMNPDKIEIVSCGGSEKGSGLAEQAKYLSKINFRILTKFLTLRFLPSAA